MSSTDFGPDPSTRLTAFRESFPNPKSGREDLGLELTDEDVLGYVLGRDSRDGGGELEH